MADWLCSLLAALWLCASQATPASAEELFLPEQPGDSVVGAVGYTTARRGQSLLDIARTFDLGHDQIISANPGMSRWVPPVGAAIRLPARYVLPAGARSGIVLNLAELRLYYFPPRSGTVLTYPVSIGNVDWRTPLGTTRITGKEVDPAWYPPASIRAEHLEEGDELPQMIPGGAEDNPLGHYAMRLGIKGYLIHGTDERRSYGIGMRVSHGCIRLYPEDIEELYEAVPVGTTVRIVDQPIKVGWRDDELYLEVHRPYEEEERAALAEPSPEALAHLINGSVGEYGGIDMARVHEIFLKGDGIPEPIGEKR
mgnify:CR=1 FL=1